MYVGAYNTNIMRMCVLFEYIRVFVAKTKGEKSNKFYLHMCVYVRVGTKKCIAVKSAECVYLYV